MDYDSDSSDFHFPTDTGLPKLSSPLDYKVPEVRDWAFEEFIQTLQDKPTTDIENLLSFKQYIPVTDEEEEDDDYGQSNLHLPTLDEKQLLQQLSKHVIQLERIELHDILKGGFNLIQNDIQTNHHQQIPLGPSWFDEAIEFGRPTIENLDSVQEERKSFNQYPPLQQNKPLPELPPVNTIALENTKPIELKVEPEKPATKKKKGLKSKIKSKLQTTKNLFRKFLPVS